MVYRADSVVMRGSRTQVRSRTLVTFLIGSTDFNSPVMFADIQLVSPLQAGSFNLDFVSVSVITCSLKIKGEGINHDNHTLICLMCYFKVLLQMKLVMMYN